MKKILSLVLVFALVLGSFGSFAATDEQVRVADILKDYKVLIGDETGNLMLDEDMTREQALVVLARFMGQEPEAAATGIQSSFTDVDHPYYEPFIAYAELKEWTNGMGNGLFGYGQDVTAQQFIAYMLRALGRGETPWEDTMSVAKEFGILENAGEINPEASILRGSAAIIMNDTLETVPANSEFKLKEVLGLESVNTNGVAEIVSVEAKNLKQMVVTLSAPLDEAGDEDNWSVDSDANFKLKDANFELSKDGKTVTITLADGQVAKQQETVDLTVKDLLEDDITVEVTFLDVTIPEATMAEVIGINTIKVTFSEPLINDAFNKDFFTVKDAKGKTYYVKGVKAQDYNREAFVELYTDFKEGEYTLKVAASGKKGKEKFRDFQDYTVKSTEFVLDVVKDTEKPFVDSFENATRYAVTLVFNEDVRFAKALKADYIVSTKKQKEEIEKDSKDIAKVDKKILEMFYHTNTKDTPYKIKKTANKVTLYFSDDKDDDHLLPEGTAYMYVKEGAVEDYWENENDDLAYQIKVELDEEAPYVTEYDVKDNGKKVELTFNETLSNPKKVEVKVVDDNGKEIKGHKWLPATTKDEKSILSLKFKKALEYGEYEFIITKAKDRSGNKMDEQTLKVTVKDEVQPDAKDDKFTATLYNGGTKDQMIIIDFNQKMDKDSITDPDNFSLFHTDDAHYKIEGYKVDSKNNTLFNNLNKAEFVAMDDNSKVKILIPYDKDEDDKDKKYPNLKDKVDKFYVKIGRLKDAAGNKMTTYGADLELKDPSTIEATAKLVDYKTVEVEVKANVMDSYDTDELKLYRAKTSNTTGSAIDVEDFDTKVTSEKTTFIFTLKESDRLDPINKGTAPEGKIYAQFSQKKDSVEDEYGNDVTKGRLWLDDKAKPEVLGIYLNATDKQVATTTTGSIYILMSEPLDEGHFAKNGNNDFVDSDELIGNEGEVVKFITTPKTFNGEKFYVIEIKTNEKDGFTADDTISYVGIKIVDLAGNKLDKFEDIEIKGTLDDIKDIDK